MARTPPARTAGQRPLLAAVALVVLAIGASAVADERAATRDPATGDRVEAPGEQAPASPEPGRIAEVVGPATGADVQTYVEDRTAALLESPVTVDTAVVSFSDVLSAGDAVDVVGGAGTVRGLLYRVPLEQAAPRAVRLEPGDDPSAALTEALQGQVQALGSERASLESLLGSDTVEDEDFIAEYERRIQEIDEALGVIEDGRLVHAVVLRGPLEQLQGLVDATAVRLVDPAPPGTDVAVSTFHGLLPGDTETVSRGRAG